MGQKVNPVGFRLPYNRNWASQWMLDLNNYRNILNQDILIREYLEGVLPRFRLFNNTIYIKRTSKEIKIYLHLFNYTEELRLPWKTIKNTLQNLTKTKVNFYIKHVSPFSYAPILAKVLAYILKHKKNKFNRVIKFCLKAARKNKAIKGLRILHSGRLRGLGRSQRKLFNYGSVPLQTLNRFIDYSSIPVLNKLGISGVKVWINYTQKLSHNPKIYKKFHKYKKFQAKILYNKKLKKKYHKDSTRYINNTYSIKKNKKLLSSKNNI